MRIGIFGGTFSPPHIGHVKAAEAFISELSLDKLIVVPAYISPGKTGTEHARAEDRLGMCRLAFDHPLCEVSDVEIARGGISYTLDTLELFRREYPRDELYLLLGEDKIDKLGEWRGAKEIFSLCTPVFARREVSFSGKAAIEEKIRQYREQFHAEIRLLTVKPFQISSAEARDMIKNGKELGEALPEAVIGYIREHRLYGAR